MSFVGCTIREGVVTRRPRGSRTNADPSKREGLCADDILGARRPGKNMLFFVFVFFSVKMFKHRSFENIIKQG